MTSFEERKAANVAKTEATMQRAWVRLQDALARYEQQVAIHEERGDGFFSTDYRRSREEAVLAQKHYDRCVSARNTAQAQQQAPTLWLEA